MSPFANHPEELISASLTDDLSEVERRELQVHLDSCATCRATLNAFREQRQLLARMPQPGAPRDLGARVRTGIEAGRLGLPWWRRPGGLLAGVATLATVAAAAMLVLFVVNGPNGLNVGQHSATPSPSPSAPAPSATAKAEPSGSATPAAVPLGMQAGDLIYLQVTGPFDGLRLTVIDSQTGEKVSIADPKGSQYGRIERAALSPDGRLLAFADNAGLRGVWRIFVADLSDGSVRQLGETVPLAFGRRLTWSPDGRYLAFTLAPVAGNGSSDAWLYDRSTASARQLTRQGNAYVASWAPADNGNEQLWISLGETNPVSQLAQFAASDGIPSGDPLDGETITVGGVFGPLVSADGSRVLYWNGSMTLDGTAGWIFSRGGMPQIAGYDRTAAEWTGTSLFSDLTVAQGGEAFSSGELVWADDSDTFAFWGGTWTGVPQGDAYPDGNGVYVGRASSGALSQASALDLGSMAGGSQGDVSVNDVRLAPDGGEAIVTLAIPLPGDLVAPQSYLRVVPTAGGSPVDVGSGGANPPPWSGPGIVVGAGVTQ